MNFEPYPNFQEFSTGRLDLEQGLVEEKIRMATEDDTIYFGATTKMKCPFYRRSVQGETVATTRTIHQPNRRNLFSNLRRFTVWLAKLLQQLVHIVRQTPLPFSPMY